MHASPAKHSFGKCDRRTDRRTDRQTTDKVIPMCRYASQATQKTPRNILKQNQSINALYLFNMLRPKQNIVLFPASLAKKKKQWQHSEECMCCLRNIAMRVWQTDGQTDRRTDGQTDGRTTDKVIPMCRYASQATQKTFISPVAGITKPHQLWWP